MQNTDNFFTTYMNYISDNTESPITYHRWSAITALGALLEKSYYLPHGHRRVNPNLYVMLIGNPGTRKSSAIKLITSLVKEAGYYNIAADKTTKEKFLEDLARVNSKNIATQFESFLDRDLTGSDPASMLISADEFNEFAGAGNLEFYALLGSLWDKQGDYEYNTKGSEIVIPDPVVTLLGGNTPTGFAAAFPSEIIGQGFFSRLLLIYGEPTGKKIAFPEPPSMQATKDVVEFMLKIRTTIRGEASMSKTARSLLKEIYENNAGMTDPRFESYSNRRFDQLLKLCLVHSAARLSHIIEEEDVILSNTVLSFAETYMPKALGEFGKAKNSEVAHRIMVALEATDTPLSIRELWQFVSNDLNNLQDLAEILRNLAEAKKIQKIEEPSGFLPIKNTKAINSGKYIDYSLLTEEEQNIQY